MNTIKSNPLLIAVFNALLTFAGACGGIFILSLIDKKPFLTMAKDPVMLIIMIVCPIIGGISAFIQARKNRQEATA